MIEKKGLIISLISALAMLMCSTVYTSAKETPTDKPTKGAHATNSGTAKHHDANNREQNVSIFEKKHN